MLRLTQSNSWNGSTSIQIKGKSLWNVDMILYFCIISLALSECIMYAFDILSQCECEYFHISHLRSREFAMHSNILGIWNWIQATMHDLDRGEIFMDYLKLINFLCLAFCTLFARRLKAVHCLRVYECTKANASEWNNELCMWLSGRNVSKQKRNM